MKQKSDIEIESKFKTLSNEAKILALIASLFDNDVKLSDLKCIFLKYQESINVNIQTQNLNHYLQELENSILCLNNIDDNNEKMSETFKNSPRIICKFKNENYKNIIRNLFINNINNYVALDKFILSCDIINPIITILNLFNNTVKENVVNITKIRFENLITEKILYDYEKLSYSTIYEKERINLENIGDNYNVLLLNKIINIYEFIQNKNLQNFILSKIKTILEALYNSNTNFSYSDIFELPILVSNINKSFVSLKESIDVYEIIVKLYNQIYIVDEYLALDLFEDFASKEYAIFKDRYFDTIRRFLKQNIINNAIFFEEQDMNEELKYLCDVSCDLLLKKYHLERDEVFFEELMEIAEYLYED